MLHKTIWKAVIPSSSIFTFLAKLCSLNPYSSKNRMHSDLKIHFHLDLSNSFNILDSHCCSTFESLCTDLWINPGFHSRMLIIYYPVTAGIFLFFSATKAHHHLLKEVNDLLFREVHGAVVEKRLRNGQLSLDRDGICWMLDEGLLLLHPSFPETGNTIPLEEEFQALTQCTNNNINFKSRVEIVIFNNCWFLDRFISVPLEM